MRVVFILSLLGLWCSFGFAQLPKDFRTEQIFLELGKTEWNPGDTLEVNGVVTCLAANRFLPYSNYLYIELLNSQDSVLVRQRVDCKKGGSFRARIPTERIYSGFYYLRSYTNLMRNFSSKSFAYQPVYIGSKPSSLKSLDNDEVSCYIYPTAGVLCPNRIQEVTASFLNSQGEPLESLPVVLLNEAGDTISSVKTSNSGFTVFHFIPLMGKRYSLSVNISGKDKRILLPFADDKKMKVQCSVNGNKLFYEVLNAKGRLDNTELYLFSRENGVCKIDKFGESGVVLLTNSPKIITLFLTDKNHQILSETSIVCKYQYPQYVDSLINEAQRTFSTDTVVLAGNRYESIRFVSDSDKWVSHAESDLLYLSDYNSPLPFPKKVFQKRTSSRFADLQAWMNTARFKRFELSEALLKDSAIYTHLPEENMLIIGKVMSIDDLVLRGGKVVAYNTRNALVYDAPVDKKGRFRMAVDDFEDGDTFFLQPVNVREQPVNAAIHFEDMTFPPAFHLIESGTNRIFSIDESGAKKGKFKDQYLPEVVVKAKYRREKPMTSAEFYGVNYVDHDHIERHNYQTLLDILRSMPGVRVLYNSDVKAEKRFSLQSTRGNSALNGSSLVLLVDGTRQDYEIESVFEMPALEIESVKLLKPWETLAYVHGALEGAIYVKTRFGKRKAAVSKGTYYTPMGLSVVKKGNIKQIGQRKDNCRMLVDVVDGADIWSFEYPMTLKTK